MARPYQLAILSDLHYPAAAEQARGHGYQYSDLSTPLLRLAIRWYRRYIWMHQPLNQNYRLDRFLRSIGSPDHVIANGDYTCDSAFVGVSDDAACESARACLDKLRGRFEPNFHAVL